MSIAHSVSVSAPKYNDELVHILVNQGLRVIETYLDDKEYNAIWQPVDNYAVIQWTTFEDDYHGYMLFPTSNDKRYFCMYYEC